MPLLDAAALRDVGRQPAVPFALRLGDGSALVMRQILRVLPGKRIVGRAEWLGISVLAKLFVGTASERHWRREKTGIEALHKGSVSSPDLLLAEALPAGGHVLLTAFIDGATSIADCWQPLAALPAGDAQAIGALAPAFAMLGQLHAVGLVQEDLHLGNFLAREGRVYVIDGDGVSAISPGRRLPRAAAEANLALLCSQLPISWDASLAELIVAYRRGGGNEIDRSRLGGAVTRARSQRVADYLDKTGRDCTLFAADQSVSQRRVVVRSVVDALERLGSLDDAIAHGKVFKDGGTCTVAHVREWESDWVIKRYNLKSVTHAIGRAWRPSRAWHSWREGHRLSLLGIATPQPLALVEERWGPLRRRAFLVNAYCPGRSLLEVLSAGHEPEPALATALLTLFASLRSARISHGDLKATNLLWDGARLWLIDLDAVCQHCTEVGYRRAWRRDRARFLRNWPADSVLRRWLEQRLPSA